MRRKLITLIGAVLLTASSANLVFAQPVPFEQKKLDQRGGSDLDEKRANDATRAIEAQRDAGRGANDAFDDLWATNIAEDSIFYKAIIGALAPITGIGFFFWVILTWVRWERDNRPPWQELVHPIATVVLLFNGGQYLAIINQSARGIIQNTTQSVFDFQIKGIQGRVHLQRERTFQAYLQIFEKLKDRCNAGSEENYEACMDNARKTSSDYLAHKRGESDDTVQEAFATDVQSIVLNNLGIINLLGTISGGFFLFLEWGVAGLAMLAPFMVAMHLIPKGRVGMSMLFGGYIALLTTSFAYAVFSVGSAAFLATAMVGQPLIYAVLTGVIMPFVAVSLGYFGFNAVLMAPAKAFSSFSRVFRRF